MTARRIVIKVGSQVLCTEQGALNGSILASLAAQVADLCRQGWQPVLVSSGAVAAGKGVMNSEPGARHLHGIPTRSPASKPWRRPGRCA